MGPNDLCGASVDESRAYFLLPFATEIFSYAYMDEPDYNKLKWMLQKILLD